MTPGKNTLVTSKLLGDLNVAFDQQVSEVDLHMTTSLPVSPCSGSPAWEQVKQTSAFKTDIKRYTTQVVNAEKKKTEKTIPFLTALTNNMDIYERSWNWTVELRNIQFFIFGWNSKHTQNRPIWLSWISSFVSVVRYMYT